MVTIETKIYVVSDDACKQAQKVPRPQIWSGQNQKNDRQPPQPIHSNTVQSNGHVLTVLVLSRFHYLMPRNILQLILTTKSCGTSWKKCFRYALWKKYFPWWYTQTFTAGGGDSLPHLTQRPGARRDGSSIGTQNLVPSTFLTWLCPCAFGVFRDSVRWSI